MNKQEQFNLLTDRGIFSTKDEWNRFRDHNPDFIPDLSSTRLDGLRLLSKNLSHANLNRSFLQRADLRKVDFQNAILTNTQIDHTWFDDANFQKASLAGAIILNTNFQRANLKGANLKAEIQNSNFSRAKFQNTDLTGVRFRHCDFYEANFENVDLSSASMENCRMLRCNLKATTLYKTTFQDTILNGADLSGAKLVESRLSNVSCVGTNFENATLIDCSVYGISIWDIKTNEHTIQSGLILPGKNGNKITIDSLEMAQFIYLILENEKLSSVIDNITSKVILILGRFTTDRKTILDKIRSELQVLGHVPIIFDFASPNSKDTTGTIELLARMARFIICDLTDAKSIPQELGMTVPFMRTTPIQPLSHKDSSEYSMFKDLMSYPWVLPIHKYEDTDSLLASLPMLIEEADASATALQQRTDS